ncbi:MAG: DUF177 domain-containing protein [Bacteroidales bacterium]|nr:DUF177 domain-containing protein [Bacteroidales bacterium]
MSGAYYIPLSGLKEGRHLFDFKIGEAFFEQFEESEVKEGSLIATVEMDKGSTHADLVIRISGSVTICCDRCLKMFLYPVNCENRLVVTFSKSSEDLDPDIISVSSDVHELDLQQHLYDFINLALPIKRVHPDGKDGKSTCDPVMLKKLEELTIEDEKEEDPRWDELKKLMNDN